MKFAYLIEKCTKFNHPALKFWPKYSHCEIKKEKKWATKKFVKNRINLYFSINYPCFYSKNKWNEKKKKVSLIKCGKKVDFNESSDMIGYVIWLKLHWVKNLLGFALLYFLFELNKLKTSDIILVIIVQNVAHLCALIYISYELSKIILWKCE